MRSYVKLAGGTVFTAVLLGSAAVQAAFIDNGLTVTDQDTGLMWVKDSGLAASQDFGVSGIGASGPADNMDWNTAQAWIAEMNTANYAGFNDWRLPECTDSGCGAHEMQTLWSVSLGNGTAPWESGNSGPFVNPINYGGHSMWLGTESGSAFAWAYLPGSDQWIEDKTSAYGIGAWAVRTTTVPVPAAVWLLGSALAGVGIVGRRKQGA